MRITRLAMLAYLGIFCQVAPSWAHHSFSGEFDVEQPVKVTGTVIEVSWHNPHSHITITVKQPDGKEVQWTAEGYPVANLRREGVASNSLQIGQVVTLDGFKAREVANRMSASWIILQDGKRLPFGPHP